MDSDSDDQLLESDRFSDLAIEMSFSNNSQNQPQPRAKYRNYHSIDWLRELSKDKIRHTRYFGYLFLFANFSRIFD